MSRALSGEHYCKDHQGNHSIYDPKNCTVCQLRQRADQAEAERDRLVQELSEAKKELTDMESRALSEQPQGVPEGWQLVPVEPTREMRKAGRPFGIMTSDEQQAARDIYKAMLAASPQPQEDTDE